MDRELRINPGLVCIERSDGYFVGHLNDQLLFPNVNLTSLLRKLQTWQPYKTLKDIAVTHQIGSEDSVNKLLEQLDAKGFLEWRSVEIQQPEIFISHMNEIGLALAPILFQDGFAVETFDQRTVRFSDVRGSFVRVANHGEKFDSVLNSQVREIINSGHSIHSAEYSLGRNSGATNYQSADKNSHKPLKDQQEQKKFVVVTAYPEPELLASLMEGEIPHLFIFSVPGGAFIGPLVRPGKNPCFHCIELQRSDNDRNWQNVALTLFSDR
jgi:hypothetical protein